MIRLTSRQTNIISVCLSCPLPECVEDEVKKIYRCPLRRRNLLDSRGQHSGRFRPRPSTLRRVITALKRESPQTAYQLAKRAGVNPITIRRYVTNNILIVDGQPERNQWKRITAVHPNYIPS